MLKPGIIILTAILSMGFAVSVLAAEGNFWTQSVYFENDLFAGTDSNYTNGVKLSLISPDLSPHAEEGKLPRKVLEVIHQIPFIRESSPSFTHKVEFSVGQKCIPRSIYRNMNLYLKTGPMPAGFTSPPPITVRMR